MADTRLSPSRDVLTVLEAAELAAALKERWGIHAGPAAFVRSADSAATPATFDVILTEAGQNKIHVIREVRTLTGLGLGEAKMLVESAPKPVLEGVSAQQAAIAVERLAEVGAGFDLIGDPRAIDSLDDDQALDVAVLGIRQFAAQTLAPPDLHLAALREQLQRGLEPVRV
jgi:large subunit ribosomal protein L7/L12